MVQESNNIGSSYEDLDQVRAGAEDTPIAAPDTQDVVVQPTVEELSSEHTHWRLLGLSIAFIIEEINTLIANALYPDDPKFQDENDTINVVHSMLLIGTVTFMIYEFRRLYKYHPDYKRIQNGTQIAFDTTFTATTLSNAHEAILSALEERKDILPFYTALSSGALFAMFINKVVQKLRGAPDPKAMLTLIIDKMSDPAKVGTAGVFLGLIPITTLYSIMNAVHKEYAETGARGLNLLYEVLASWLVYRRIDKNNPDIPVRLALRCVILWVTTVTFTADGIEQMIKDSDDWLGITELSIAPFALAGAVQAGKQLYYWQSQGGSNAQNRREALIEAPEDDAPDNVTTTPTAAAATPRRPSYP